MKGIIYVLGVSARRSEKTGDWFADIYTAEPLEDAKCGCLGGRMRASQQLAPRLQDVFESAGGGGWYEADMASAYMGQNQISIVQNLVKSASKDPAPFSVARGTGTPPRG